MMGWSVHSVGDGVRLCVCTESLERWGLSPGRHWDAMMLAWWTSGGVRVLMVLRMLHLLRHWGSWYIAARNMYAGSWYYEMVWSTFKQEDIGREDTHEVSQPPRYRHRHLLQRGGILCCCCCCPGCAWLRCRLDNPEGI